MVLGEKILLCGGYLLHATFRPKGRAGEAQHDFCMTDLITTLVAAETMHLGPEVKLLLQVAQTIAYISFVARCYLGRVIRWNVLEVTALPQCVACKHVNTSNLEDGIVAGPHQ